MLLEGVGDEVLYAVAAFSILLIVLLAWLSTNVGSNTASHHFLVHVQTPSTQQERVVEVLSVDNPDSNTPDIRPVETASDVTRVETVNAEASINNVTNVDFATSVSDAGLDQRLDAENGQQQTVEDCSSSQSQIRLKFLDETQRRVRTWLSQTVGEFKTQNFESEVREGKVIRLIYNGQLMRDDSRSLESYGVQADSIVHCHVSSTPLARFGAPTHASSNQSTPSQHHSSTWQQGASMNVNHQHFHPGQPLNPGRQIYAVFGLVLGLLWFAWYKYPELFEFSSMFTLVMASVIYASFFYTSRRAQQRTDERFRNMARS